MTQLYKSSIMLLLGLFSSACSNTSSNDILKCEQECDSLHYSYQNGELLSIHRYYEGKPTGSFVLFDQGDTVFGVEKRIGAYFKRSMKLSDSLTIVKLFVEKDGVYEIVEQVVYSNGEILPASSLFLKINDLGKQFKITPSVIYNYDSVYAYQGETIVNKVDSTNDLVIRKKLIDELNDDPIVVHVFKFKKNTEGFERSGLDFPLFKERFEKEDIMKPDKF